MKKRKLQKAVFISYALYALLLVLITSTLVIKQHLSTINNENKMFAFSFTRSAAELIDGDAVEKYYQTGEKDEYYERIQSYLSATVDNSNLVSFYVAIPRENDVFLCGTPRNT